MKRLFPWALGTTLAAPANKETKAGGGESSFDNETTKRTISSSELSEHIPELTAISVDPKVTEFFKDFPEPYRQKAIQRFSSREGLYRWDFLRDMFMQDEKSTALRGVFLEDRREAEEIARQKKETERIKANEEAKKHFHERQVPEWERQLLKVIPLQPGETMVFKLLQTCNLAVIAATALWVGVLDRKNTTLPRWKLNFKLVSGVGMFFWFNYVAAARLMDKGPFDRSVDDRDLPAKLEDELRQYYKVIEDFLKTDSRP